MHYTVFIDRSMIWLLLILLVWKVDARRPSMIPRSCDVYQREHDNCIKQVMIRDRIYVNVDSINDCFEHSELVYLIER